METSSSQLAELLRLQTVCISYKPLPGEIDPGKIPFIAAHSHYHVEIPQNPDTDPFLLAQTYQNELKGESVYLLVPGTAFDLRGTRHGRGGGWFDRFLSAVPRDWIRVGLAKASQFSSSTLPRKEWDEPMDWVIVEGSGWEIHKTS